MKLFGFIAQQSTVSPRVQWLGSSRNWPNIEEGLDRAGQKLILCLELNAESVSTAVGVYIRHKTLQLTRLERYDAKMQAAVLQHLIPNANGTLLWVTLVCQNLENIPQWKTLAKLDASPPGLVSLYQRMMEQIYISDEADLCKQILALAAIVYKPIALRELKSLIDMLEDISDDLESLREVVGLCDSFLIIGHSALYLVHQSAKAVDKVFPYGARAAHHRILSRSLQILSKTLCRDMYSLCALGHPIERIEQPEPDPLAALRYSCIYWVDHLCERNSNSHAHESHVPQDGGIVEIFMREKYFYWLEALSLCTSMSAGVHSMAKFEAFLSVSLGTPVNVFNKR